MLLFSSSTALTLLPFYNLFKTSSTHSLFFLFFSFFMLHFFINPILNFLLLSLHLSIKTILFTHAHSRLHHLRYSPLPNTLTTQLFINFSYNTSSPLVIAFAPFCHFFSACTSSTPSTPLTAKARLSLPDLTKAPSSAAQHLSPHSVPPLHYIKNATIPP